MARIELPKHIVESLKQVALDQKFEEPEFHFSEGSDKGFIGLIKRCLIEENDRKLSVMCKFLPSDQSLNRKFSSYELFEREVLVYQRFLPLVEKIQLDHGLMLRDLDGFWAFPKCYASEYNSEQPEKSFIIMEDLSVENFTTEDMFKPTDFEHTKRIFTELGKFHAISFALQNYEAEAFAEFKSLNDLMSRLMTTDAMKDVAPRNCQLVSELFNLPEEAPIKNKILTYKNNLWQQMENVLSGLNAEPFGVVCHGDCWVNNVMFNYKDGAIKDVRLIDWQMTRFGSGPSELVYFLFCYNDKISREKHQPELIKLYYESLRLMLERFGLDVLKVFPFNELEKQLKISAKFAFAMTSFTMPIICKYPEKLFKDKLAPLTDDEKAALALYNKTMKEVVIDLLNMDDL